MNAFSFLTYNVGGDGDNVWPFVARDAKLHYDCSKLDQWQVVFDHAQSLGLFLHFKTQETENDDQRLSHERTPGTVPEALDGGAVGVERRLYYRELVARFGYLLALNWNLGEENTQTPAEQRAMAEAFRELDPYGHLRVVHTHPGDQDLVYTPLLGEGSALTGASLQNQWDVAHQRVLKWRRESAKAGKPWVVANDEQGDAALGVPPDPGFEGFSGRAKEKERPRVRPPRRPAAHALGHAHGRRRRGRVLLRLLPAAERPPRRGLAEPRALVGLRADRAATSSATSASRSGRWSRPTRSSATRPRTTPATASRSPARSTSSISRRVARRSWTSRGPRPFHRRLARPPEGRPASERLRAEVEGGRKAALGTPPSDPDDDWLAVVRRADPTSSSSSPTTSATVTSAPMGRSSSARRPSIVWPPRASASRTSTRARRSAPPRARS